MDRKEEVKVIEQQEQEDIEGRVVVSMMALHQAHTMVVKATIKAIGLPHS
jgi:hypothetical protein